MRKVKIITDSASDLPEQFYKDYDISMLAMGVVFEDRTYLDRVEIDSKTFFKLMKENQDSLPKTSMPSVASIKEEFMRNLDSFEHQIFVCISSKGSGTYNIANIVKSEIEEETGKKSNITVVDSYSYSAGYSMAVAAMAKVAFEGGSFDEVMDIFNEVRQSTKVDIVLDDLKHLQRGGRIKPGAALVGSMLGIKPLLTINDGLLENYGKERGKRRAIEKIVDKMISSIGDPSKTRVWLVHADADEDVEVLKNIVCEKITPMELVICEIGACIGVHTGGGLVGVVYSEGAK